MKKCLFLGALSVIMFFGVGVKETFALASHFYQEPVITFYSAAATGPTSISLSGHVERGYVYHWNLFGARVIDVFDNPVTNCPFSPTPGYWAAAEGCIKAEVYYGGSSWYLPITPSTITSGDFTATRTGIACGHMYDVNMNMTPTNTYAGSNITGHPLGTYGELADFGLPGNTEASAPPTISLLCAPPTVSTYSIIPSSTTATLIGRVMDTGGAPSVTVGFKYSMTSLSDSAWASATDLPGTPSSMTTTGFFNSNMSSLACGGATYHIRPYATSAGGVIGWGTASTFTTLACGATSGIVETFPATAITGSTSTLNGKVHSLGTASSVDVSFRYSTVSGFGGGSTATSSSMLSSPGVFNKPVTGLACATTYYYRAYAEVSGLTIGAGAEIPFTTGPCPLSVSTVPPATSITGASAVVHGSLVSTGGVPGITVRFRYGTSAASLTTIAGAGTLSAPGAFSTTLSGLSCGVTYYYQAAALAGGAAATGSVQSFTTATPCGSPAVATGAASSSGTLLTGYGMTMKGNLTYTGGWPSTTVGFEYGPTSTYGSSVTASSSMTSTGPYSYTLPGLPCATTYHYRAVATNASGGAYDKDMTFTTRSCASTPTGPDGSSSDGAAGPLDPLLPTVLTDTVTISGPATALIGTLKGKLTGLGSGPNATVGFKFSASPLPVVDIPITPPMTATGPFSNPVASLECGKTYHYQAYATNSHGTVYGVDKTFTPCSGGGDTTTSPKTSLDFSVGGMADLFVTAGSKVTLGWEAENIEPGTCVGTSSPVQRNWDRTPKEPFLGSETGTGRYEEVIESVASPISFTISGCTGVDGTKLGSKTVGVFIQGAGGQTTVTSEAGAGAPGKKSRVEWRQY